jgi:hypothetical protein
VPWSTLFDDPIIFPKGQKLATLRDATTYITDLPKKESALPEWQAAIEALMLCCRGGDPMMARIGVMRALNRDVQQVFNTDRKETLGANGSLSGINSQWPGYPQQIHRTSTVRVFAIREQRHGFAAHPFTGLGPTLQKEPAIRDGSQSGRKPEQSKSIRRGVMCLNSHRTSETPRIARHWTEARLLSCSICS